MQIPSVVVMNTSPEKGNWTAPFGRRTLDASSDPVTVDFAPSSAIFDRLSLKATSMPAIEDAAIGDSHPQGYMFGTNVSTLADAALPEAEQSAAASGSLRPSDVTSDNPSWTWAAGGAVSTAGDLSRYVTAMVDGGLLDAKFQKTRMDSLLFR